MLIQKNVHLVTIFSHEEKYDDLLAFLKARAEVICIPEGFKAICDANVFALFVNKFEVEPFISEGII